MLRSLESEEMLIVVLRKTREITVGHCFLERLGHRLLNRRSDGNAKQIGGIENSTRGFNLRLANGTALDKGPVVR